MQLDVITYIYFKNNYYLITAVRSHNNIRHYSYKYLLYAGNVILYTLLVGLTICCGLKSKHTNKGLH